MNIENTNCVNCGGPLPQSRPWAKCVYCGTNHHITPGQKLGINPPSKTNLKSDQPLTLAQKMLVVACLLTVPMILAKTNRYKR